MPDYVFDNITYEKELKDLTIQYEKLKADQQACVAKLENNQATKYQLGEIEYELSKAELALANFRLDHQSKKQIHF